MRCSGVTVIDATSSSGVTRSSLSGMVAPRGPKRRILVEEKTGCERGRTTAWMGSEVSGPPSIRKSGLTRMMSLDIVLVSSGQKECIFAV